MIVNLTTIALLVSYFLSLVSAAPQAVERRDLVHDVVVILQLLHASPFCSSFAPQSTVTVTNTLVSSATATTTSISTAIAIASETASATSTLLVTSTVTLGTTATSTITQTNTVTITGTATITSTSSILTTVTSNIVKGAPARLAKRAIPKPSALIQYADNILSSACHSYLPVPTQSTTLTQTSTVTQTAVETQTSTSTTVAATSTILTTVSLSTTVFSTATITATSSVPTTQSTVATITTTIKTTVPVATKTFTYSVATAGTGCGDIAYYNFLQDNVVTQEQCLQFCDADPSCASVMLQCSQSEPCECTVNHNPYAVADIQCALPTQYYGPFTWWNKVA